jgi:type I restriction enzyme S subunit
MSDKINLEMVESWSGTLTNTDHDPDLSTGLVAFREGDVLFSKLRPYLAKAYRPESSGAASPEFLVLSPTDVNPDYLFYVLLSRESIDKINASTYGAKMPRASWDFIGGLKVPCPPFSEQRAISNYLDKNTELINKTINKKQKLVSALSERLLALRAEYVLRGVESHDDFRSTDIPVVEEIPEQWDDSKIGWHIRRMRNGWSPSASNKPAEGDDYGVLKLSAVSKGDFEPSENKALDSQTDVDTKYLISKGDVLLTRANTPELVGDACYVEQDYDKLIAPDLMYILKMDPGKMLPEYLVEWLTTPHARAQIRADAHGSSQSMVKISQSAVSDWRMPLPPMKEQQQIVDRLKELKNEHARCIANIRRSIDLLHEKRKVLITKAVTGQIDLSDWQPSDKQEASL